MQTFEQILQKYRDISFSERDKGYRFERLMQSFLKTYPTYANLFTSIWLWNEFGFVVFTEAKEGDEKILILTEDNPNGGIDSKYFDDIIRKHILCL